MNIKHIPAGAQFISMTGGNGKSRLPRFLLLAASSVATITAAFDNAGWKKDADGKLVLDADGNPIYVNSAGAEQSVKGDTIANLNAEAKTHREGKETLQKQLDKFKGADGKLLDPEVAIKSVDIVGKLDAKKLIDAGEVDKVREQIEGTYKTQLQEKDQALNDARGTIDKMTIDGVFKGNPFIADRIAIPADFFEAQMRSNFKVEEGKVTAYDRAGNRIMSKKNVGEYADPTEALELLVETHPQKDALLKAPAAGGSGNGGGGGGRGGGNVMKRSDFDALPATQKPLIGAKVAAGEMSIAD